MTTARTLLEFDATYAREVPGMSLPWSAADAPAPALLALNEELAAELGVDQAALREPDGVRFLVGQGLPEGVTPVAQVYAGHQFGMYQPRLGDGRALLLGDVVDLHGRRRDLHLKGSGRTPFARGGDGLAVVGPMLLEYLMGEAMHALGIPTTRALAVVATGTTVQRERLLPGAVLCRVAGSHLRVGTFQYAAATGDRDVLRALADHAIARHHPEVADADQPYLELFRRVCAAQADLVARWMLVGFVHGVMNTDNTTISGETIDYGPCAFMDRVDPATVFSSIDARGRYAYGNQPSIVQWNLARLGEALVPLLTDDDDLDTAGAALNEVLAAFPDVYAQRWAEGMAAKLGIAEPDLELGTDLMTMLHAQRIDFTSFFRALAAGTARDLFLDRDAFDIWAARRDALLPADRDAVAAGMNRLNPVVIPRNHHVEPALRAAERGDLAPFRRLLGAVSSPFEERADLADLVGPPPEDAIPHVTYCGT
ncbi:MAG: YdiU family protein [Pseudonocardia sp.]|uniref:protein adenylyltransferase SelO n=1 Tax=unclassified Pseudonocardia TaxID=2619320 RepID=UPI000AC40A6C|nr:MULTISPECIES: YdiU family protein [unclassified Pseudonocardia]MBN9110897.1 YdiU family protein [Pseudonocardia sp.]